MLDRQNRYTPSHFVSCSITSIAVEVRTIQTNSNSSPSSSSSLLLPPPWSNPFRFAASPFSHPPPPILPIHCPSIAFFEQIKSQLNELRYIYILLWWWSRWVRDGVRAVNARRGRTPLLPDAVGGVPGDDVVSLAGLRWADPDVRRVAQGDDRVRIQTRRQRHKPHAPVIHDRVSIQTGCGRRIIYSRIFKPSIAVWGRPRLASLHNCGSSCQFFLVWAY